MKDFIKMNNIIKKVSAIAMAFTLLGTGTTIVKTVSPKSDNTLVASAKIHREYGDPDTPEYWVNAPSSYDNFYQGCPYNVKVAWIQRTINYLTGYGLSMDGWYGAKTKAAVKYLQQRFNSNVVTKRSDFARLDTDGCYGPKTHQAVCFLLKYAANYGFEQIGW